MRILVCGSRAWTDELIIMRELAQFARAFGVEVVIEGGASGADAIGKRAATKLDIPVLTFPADWKRHGRAAGPIRNKQMLDEGKPDQVLAFWDGRSRGTNNMIEISRSAGIPVKVVRQEE